MPHAGTAAEVLCASTKLRGGTRDAVASFSCMLDSLWSLRFEAALAGEKGLLLSIGEGR